MEVIEKCLGHSVGHFRGSQSLH